MRISGACAPSGLGRTRRVSLQKSLARRDHSRDLFIPTRERSETGEPALSEVEGNLLFAAGRHSLADPPWRLLLNNGCDKVSLQLWGDIILEHLHRPVGARLLSEGYARLASQYSSNVPLS